MLLSIKLDCFPQSPSDAASMFHFPSATAAQDPGKLTPTLVVSNSQCVASEHGTLAVFWLSTDFVPLACDTAIY